MNKINFSVLLITAFLFTVPLALAFNTSSFLETTGTALAELSTEHATSGSKSAKLWADVITGPANEGRVRVEFNELVTLTDITSISWEQFVDLGYISHVDVKISTDGDATEDDALVFEYAKVDPLDCDDSADYPTGAVTTFDDKGTSITDTSYAWLSSGPAGPCGDSTFDSMHHSLADWKLGQAGVPADVRVIALEFEVDGWIEESTSFIDDIMLNGALVQDFEGIQGAGGEITPDFTFIPNPNPLDFGQVSPGHSSVALSTLSVGNSNLKVMDIQVNPTSGTLFDEPNVMFGTDGVSFGNASSVTPLSIAAQGSEDLYVELTIPVGTTSGSFTGQIVYTVLEDI